MKFSNASRISWSLSESASLRGATGVYEGQYISILRILGGGTTLYCSEISSVLSKSADITLPPALIIAAHAFSSAADCCSQLGMDGIESFHKSPFDHRQISPV